MFHTCFCIAQVAFVLLLLSKMGKAQQELPSVMHEIILHSVSAPLNYSVNQRSATPCTGSANPGTRANQSTCAARVPKPGVGKPGTRANHGKRNHEKFPNTFQML